MSGAGASRRDANIREGDRRHAETEEDLADLEEDEAMTRRALDLLGAGKADAYDAALTALV